MRDWRQGWADGVIRRTKTSAVRRRKPKKTGDQALSRRDIEPISRPDWRPRHAARAACGEARGKALPGTFLQRTGTSATLVFFMAALSGCVSGTSPSARVAPGSLAAEAQTIRTEQLR